MTEDTKTKKTAEKLHKQATANQDKTHKEKKTHPGKGWIWHGNIGRRKDHPLKLEDSALPEQIRAITGAKEVKFVEAAYDGEGAPLSLDCDACSTFYSVWIKK